MKKATVVIVALIAVFSGCSKDESIRARFWPLAGGNQWTTTEEYSWNVAEGTYAGSSSSTTDYTAEDSTERADGKLVWPVEVSTDTSGSQTGLIISRTYYHVTEDSVYLYKQLDDVTPDAVEPNNLEIGNEWDGNIAFPINIPDLPSFPTNFPAHFTVVGQETVSDVPAGTFDCLVIQIDLDNAGTTVDSAVTQWRAENVGIVKMTTDFTTVYKILTQEYDVIVQGSSELTSINWTP